MPTSRTRVSRRWVLRHAAGLGAFRVFAWEGSDVAVVVRPDVPVDNLTFAELRKLML